MADSGKGGGQNFLNRTLFQGDCDDVMRQLNSKSINLIAIDPPFNTGLDFPSDEKSPLKGAGFQDRWTWTENHDRWLAGVREDGHNGLAAVVEAAKHASGSQMGAFVCWFSVRLLRMHRILTDDGSIFIHLDHHAVHYIKAACDAVFGEKNFRNEIIWCYDGSGRGSSTFSRKHDTILYYAKSDKHKYRPVKVPITKPSAIKRFNKIDENGDAYQISGRGYKYYLKDGKNANDWWEDIPALGSSSNERSGYRTQKPLDLYRRIILAATEPGDWVLDSFAGCATTCIAAEVPDPAKPGQGCRNWIGIDLWPKAGEVIQKRVQKECDHLEGGEVIFTDKWPKRTDRGETAVIKDLVRVVKPNKVTDGLTKHERKEALLQRAGGNICAGCGRDVGCPEFLQIDHITPRTEANIEHIENSALLCPPCNRLKSNELTLQGLRKALLKAAEDEKHILHEFAKNSPLVTQAKK